MSVLTFDIPEPSLSLRERVEQLPKGEKLPIIEIRTGSDSDFPKIKGLLEGLKDYPILLRIASAHRTPEAMTEIAKAFPNVLIVCNKRERPFYSEEDKIIASKLHVVCAIAGAGGSAHIAGMTASETLIPVLGYPVSSSTNGQSESHASMCHMPPGIPNGVSAYEAVLVDQAKAIYARTEESSEKIYITEDIPIDAKTQALIDKIGLQVTRVIDEAGIGIHTHKVSGKSLDYAWMERKHVEQAVLSATKSLETKISIVNPIYDAPLDTDDRSHKNAQRKGILDLNLLTTPGLSMGSSVESKTNLTNSILFAAEIIGIHNEKVRSALAEYRTESASNVRENDIAAVRQQLQ